VQAHDCINAPLQIYTYAMPNYSHISIRLGGLQVELGTDTAYPDMISDLTARCLSTFNEAVDKAVENKIDLNMPLHLADYDDDEDDF
jgi:hypothetical protein